jgi:hypothetical protein
MNAAGYKKSPRGRGGHGAKGNSRTIINIDKNRENVKLPDWMRRKIAKIAARKDDFALFEEQAVILLAAECSTFPKQAARIPESLREKLTYQRPDMLDPLERASIAIIAAQVEDLADIFVQHPYEDFFDLKARALAITLEEGGRV